MKSILNLINNIKRGTAVLLLGLIFTIFFTFPFILNLSKHYPGRTDFLLNAWTYHYSSTSILDGTFFNPQKFFTQPQLYPFPLTLAQADFYALPSLLFYLPVYLLSNNHVLSVNFVSLISFTLNFVSCYLCLRYLTKNSVSSVLGSVIFAFSPGVIDLTSGHMEYLGRYLIPPFFVFMHRFLEKPDLKSSTAIFLTYFLSWFTNIELSIFLTFISTAWVILYLILSLITKTLQKAKAINLFKYSLLYFFMLSPIIFYFFSPYIDYSNKENFTRPLNEVDFYSARIIDFVLPGPNNVILGDTVKSLIKFRTDDVAGFPHAEHILSPGISVWLLTILFLIGYFFVKKSSFRRLPGSGRFLILSSASLVFSIIFAFGPYLHIGMATLKLPYYYAYESLFVLQAVRTPTRIFYVWLFFIAYIIARGLSDSLSKMKRSRQVVICLLLLAIVSVEYLTHFRSAQFKREGLNFNLDNYPTLFLPIRSGEWVDDTIYLTQHLKNSFRSVNGLTGSETEIKGYVELDSFLKRDVFGSEWFNVLQSLKIKYIAVDKKGLEDAFSDQITSEDLKTVAHLIIYNDENWAVIDVDRFSNIYGNRCRNATIKDLTYSYDAFYNTHNKSLFLTYNFANGTGCSIASIYNDRYLKINIYFNNRMITMTGTLLPVILPGNSMGGAIDIFENGREAAPETVSVSLDGGLHKTTVEVVATDTDTPI
jgi:hypothetical protein